MDRDHVRPIGVETPEERAASAIARCGCEASPPPEHEHADDCPHGWPDRSAGDAHCHCGECSTLGDPLRVRTLVERLLSALNEAAPGDARFAGVRRAARRSLGGDRTN